MVQLSEEIFCDAFIASLKYPNTVTPSPYVAYPFMLIDHFLDEATCKQIELHVKASKDAKKATLRSSTHNDNRAIRHTDIYTLTPTLLEHYNENMEALKAEIEEFFYCSLTTASKPQLLAYEAGGYYRCHSDDSSELRSKEGKLIGFKQVAPERKITTLLFVNDDFNGGELMFNYLYNSKQEQVVLKPKRGQMVVFPSNPIFSHEVLHVKEGLRISIAQWHNAL